jgi:hypothetical protein
MDGWAIHNDPWVVITIAGFFGLNPLKKEGAK